MRNFIEAGFAGFAVAALVAIAPAKAEMIAFKTDLKPSEEVPPVTAKGSGMLEANYDTTSKKLAWKGSYSGLTGAATAAHFHGPAEAGKNAGVAVPAPAPKSPFEGSATLTDAQAADLMGGKWYFNLHTAANPGGEIRGQMTKGK